MAADLTSTPSSPTTPKSHRKKLQPPWTQVVRGETDSAIPLSPEKDTVSPKQATTKQSMYSSAAPGESSEDNAALSKKSAWKSVNGVVEPGPVMGGAAWPTITESTRASPKASPGSSKPVIDGPVSQEQVISHAPQKQATANGHTNFNHNHKQPHRQRSMKKGGNAGAGSGQSGFGRSPPLPPPPPPFPKPYGNILSPGMEMPIREPAPYRGNNRDARPVGSHSQDHSSHRHTSRRGNFGSRPSGDGGYNSGYGVRRDQEREWNASRNTSGREVHMHQMVPPPPPPPLPPPRGLTRPVLPYISPQHVRPYGTPMPFDMVRPFLYVPQMPPDSYRGVPLVLPSPTPMYYPVIDPVMDPGVRNLLLNQIDYYFSEANLVKDDFLRSKMDDQGWVSVSLIASFPRVSKFAIDVQFILDTLVASTVVEVQGDKIRKRDNWMKWIPTVTQTSSGVGLQSQSEPSYTLQATSSQEVQLEKITINEVANTNTNENVSHSTEKAGSVQALDSKTTESEPAKVEKSAEASN